MFEKIFRMQSVNRRIAALFYGSVVKALKVRPVVCRKKVISSSASATRTTRYYDDLFIVSKTNLSLSWLENRRVWAGMKNFNFVLTLKQLLDY